MSAVYLKVLCDADGDRRSYFGEAIEDCSTDFGLGDLTIKGTGHNALAQELKAVHFGLDKTATMIAAPLLPDSAAKALCSV